MTEYQQGVEAAAKTLDAFATGDALMVNGSGIYVWTDKKTLIAAAAAIRAVNGWSPDRE